MIHRDSLHILVRPEPFAYGQIHMTCPSKLSSKFLRRIVIYAASRYSQCFPLISTQMWKHIANQKLQLPPELAEAYLCIFSSLSYSSNMSARYYSPQESTLNVLCMVVFLFLQRLDGGPAKDNHSDSDMIASDSNRFSLLGEDYNWLAFLQINLRELIGILCSSSWQNCRELLLPEMVVEALEFVICVDDRQTSHNRRFSSLLQLAKDPMFIQSSGYLQEDRAFRVDQFTSWLIRELVVSPNSISSMGTSRDIDLKYNGIITDAENANCVLFDRCQDETLLYSNEERPTEITPSVYISCCSKCYIYALSASFNASVVGCSSCTLVLGPVAGCVRVERCREVQLVVPAGRLLVSNSSDCSFYIITATRPILVKDNCRSLLLAPFNTNYGHLLKQQMKAARLSSEINAWSEPLCVSSTQSSSSDGDTSCWSLLPPDRFFVLRVPFQLGPATNCGGSYIAASKQDHASQRRHDASAEKRGSGETVPTDDEKDDGVFGTLPPAFDQSLQQRREAWRSVCLTVHQSCLSQQQYRRLRRLTRRRFHDWLIAEDRQHELNSLSHFRHIRQSSS